jgi:ParB family chromosome partitioning protein
MIVANIREVGLKKPITVVRRREADADGKLFDLVCGQGRIEAFIALAKQLYPRSSRRRHAKTSFS